MFPRSSPCTVLNSARFARGGGTKPQKKWGHTIGTRCITAATRGRARAGDRREKARNAWFEIGVKQRSPIRFRSVEEDMKRYLLSFLIVAAFLAGNSYNARAQSEITLIAPGGARAVLDQLIPEF